MPIFTPFLNCCLTLCTNVCLTPKLFQFCCRTFVFAMPSFQRQTRFIPHICSFLLSWISLGLKGAVFGSITEAHLEQLCLTAALLEKSEGPFQLSELPEDQAGASASRFIIFLSVHLHCSCVLLLFIFCIVCVHAFQLLISRLSHAVLMSVQSPLVFTGSWWGDPASSFASENEWNAETFYRAGAAFSPPRLLFLSPLSSHLPH